MGYLILAINPGSTSTKIAVFEDHKQVFTHTIRHSAEEISSYKKIADQYEFRKDAITNTLKENNIDLSTISIIVGRGGVLKPIKSGVYEVNEAMKQDLIIGIGGEHASNLGGLIASNIASEIRGCKAYIADPVVVDELSDVARVSGHPLLPKISIFHALNQKAISKIYAESEGKDYHNLRLIVAHLGGGVSVGAHLYGKVVDVNNALNGEGPFSPERSGTLPAYALAELCFSGKYTLADIKKIITGEGGVVAHLGTNSFNVVERKVSEGDVKYTLISDAFGYNVAKAIGAAAAALSGNVDAILLTGGVAYNSKLMDKIADMVKFIAPIKIYPGEDEMAALAMNGLDVLTGKVTPSVYQ